LQIQSLTFLYFSTIIISMDEETEQNIVEGIRKFATDAIKSGTYREDDFKKEIKWTENEIKYCEKKGPRYPPELENLKLKLRDLKTRLEHIEAHTKLLQKQYKELLNLVIEKPEVSENQDVTNLNIE